MKNFLRSCICAVISVIVSACSGGSEGSGEGNVKECEAEATATVTGPFDVPSANHVILVVLENTDAKKVLQQPYMAELKARGAYLNDFVALTRPSQPNYLALMSGDTHGVVDSNPQSISARHMGNLLEDKGKSWKAYAESYPGGCFMGESAGAYVRKHMPFLSFKNVQSIPSRCAKVVNADEFFIDADADNLPNFSLFVPNQESNGHDSDIAFAAAWLESTFEPYLSDATFMQDKVFILTFDEASLDSSNSDVYTVVLGGEVKAGSSVNSCTNHYNLLRTMEELLGLDSFGLNDAQRSPLQGIWQ